MFNLYSPIDYTTNVNAVLNPYITGQAVGMTPYLVNSGCYFGGGGLFDITPAPYINIFNNWNYTTTPQNIFQFLPSQNYMPLFNNTSSQYTQQQYFRFNSSPNKTENKKVEHLKTEKKTTETKSTDTKQPKNKTIQGQDFLNTANKYSNCKETDNSHLKFCVNEACVYEDPYNEEWCTDFVTYVVKESYKNKGLTAPAGFGEHDVRRMKIWAIHNNKFIHTANKSQKGKFIAENIKPGDIFILNENGASHTGFVTKVNSDGSFSTIEGNRNDKVGSTTYSPDFNQLSGFIRLS